MLSMDDLMQIDHAAKTLLEEPGIEIDDDIVYETLIKQGAKKGRGNSVIRFPVEMVSEFIKTAPSEFILTDRNENIFTVTPNSSSLFWTGAAMFYLDRRGFREITKKDLADFSRLIDVLPNVNAVVGTSIKDVPPVYRDFVSLHVMAANTGKHLRALSFTPDGSRAMVEMAEVLSAGKSLKNNPVFSIGFTAHGPLRWTSLALGIFRATAGHGIPVTVNGEPMAGASSPVTLAGALAVGTAEILAGIIINQVLEEGRPCFFNLGFAHVMDMRSGFAVTGGPENVLLAVAGADLARYYNLPSVSWMCSDSLLYDGQNSMEKMIAALEHYKARVSVVWGVGQLESEKTISPVQAVIDNEIISMVKKYNKGIKVNEETIALKEIQEIGIQGNFLGTEHTFKHFKGAIYEPDFLVRKQRPPDNREKSLIDRADEFVRNVTDDDAYREILTSEQNKRLGEIEKKYMNI